MRTLTPASAAMAIVVALTTCLEAADGPPAVDKPPNIVLIGMDALRSDHLGCYGYGRPTSPNIDLLASQGVLFERCYSTASTGFSSFMSIFTGLNPAVHSHILRTDKLMPAIPTLPERLKQKGYYCVAVAALDGSRGLARGFDLYDDYTCYVEAWLHYSIAGGIEPSLDYGLEDLVLSDVVTRRAVELLKRAQQSGKPFFLFVHYRDPYPNYVPPFPYNVMFDPDYEGKMNGRDVDQMRTSPPAGRDLEHMKARYDGEIAYTDRELGRFLDALNKTADPENTLVILVGDDGEALAEHGKLSHGHSAYREEVCVPMIWRWSGRMPPGHRVKTLVTQLDMVVTLRDLLRLDNLDLIQGRSLWSGLVGKQMPEDRQVFFYQCWRPETIDMAVTQDHLRLHAQVAKYLDRETWQFRLFDVEKDPGERNDLFGTGHPDEQRLREALERLRSECLALRAYFQSRSGKAENSLAEKDRRLVESLGYVAGAPAKTDK